MNKQPKRYWALYYMFKHAQKWQPEIQPWGNGQSIILRLDGNYFNKSQEEMQEILEFWRNVHRESAQVADVIVETAQKVEEVHR